MLRSEPDKHELHSIAKQENLPKKVKRRGVSYLYTLFSTSGWLRSSPLGRVYPSASPGLPKDQSIQSAVHKVLTRPERKMIIREMQC